MHCGDAIAAANECIGPSARKKRGLRMTIGVELMADC